MTTTTERPKSAPMPPADAKGELRPALKILDRFKKQLADVSPGYRQWIIDSLQATFPLPGDE